jgi:hypothetical protein
MASTSEDVVLSNWPWRARFSAICFSSCYTCEDLALGDDEGSASSLNRLRRMESLVQNLATAPPPPDLPAGLI